MKKPAVAAAGRVSLFIRQDSVVRLAMTASKCNRHKSAKSQLFAVIRSISLETVAQEVTAKRLKDTRRKLESATASAKKRMPRLARLFDSGELDHLPTDMQADADRMKRVLLALHQLMKPGVNALTRSVDDIARMTSLKPSTVRRGILDLEAASLLIVRRKRSNRTGGQGMSEYRFVLSTLRDIALTQGLQAELFESECVAKPDGKPAENATENRYQHPTVEERSSTVANRSPTVSERPLTVGGPIDRAREDTPSESSTTSTAGCNPPAESFEEDAGKRKNEIYLDEKQEPCDVSAQLLEQNAVQRLRDFQITTAAKTIRDALRHGWSLPQIDEFLNELDRTSIDGHQKFQPGHIVWKLAESGDPLSPMGGKRLNPAWEFARAQRREREQAERDEREREENRRSREEDKRKAAEREERLGPVLDAMTVYEVADLVEQLPDIPSVRVSDLPRLITGTFRPRILKHLDEATATNSRKGEADAFVTTSS